PLTGSAIQSPPAPLPGDTEADAVLLAAASPSQSRGTPLLVGNGVFPFARDAQPEQARFKGSLEGVVTMTPLDPTFGSVLGESTGNATQLGQFTLTIPHIVNRANRTAIGSYHFVAANGDTLSATFSGQATPTATPSVLSIVETATITGGTGRFAGATGNFTVQRLFDSVASTTVGSFEGTISSPGS